MVQNDERSIDTLQIVEIPKKTKYWIVRADGGRYTNDFYFNNKVSIDGENIHLNKVDDNYSRFREYLIEQNLKQDKEASIQSISSRARKIHNFVKNINKDDVVMTPFKESNQFLLGIVASNAAVYSQKDLDRLEKQRNKDINNYPISKNTLYRDVKWLRVVDRHEIDPSLLYTLRMHQAVINLENNIHHIDKLISPLYIKEEHLVLSTRVLKADGINSDEWENFYTSFNKLKMSYQKPEIKTNVQSPGVIDFVMENRAAAGIALIVAFNLLKSGTIKYGDFEITSTKLIRNKDDKRRSIAEIETKELNNEKIKEEVREKRIKNDREELLNSYEAERLARLKKEVEQSFEAQKQHLENRQSDIAEFKKISEELSIRINVDDENESQ